MKFWVIVLQIIVLAFLLELFLPWWAVAIAAAVGGFNAGGLRPWRNLGAGFVSIFIFWAAYAAIITFTTGSALPDKFAHVLSPALNATLLMLITGFFGAIAGAFGALAGGQLRRVMTGK